MLRKWIFICGGIVLALVILSLLFPVQSGHQIPKRQYTKLNIQYLITACAGYRVEYGNLPRGDTAQITRTLLGANPHKIVFLAVESRFKNPRGEVLDGWGTPLRITFKDQRIIVASAGRDRSFGTEDDITLSKP